MIVICDDDGPQQIGFHDLHNAAQTACSRCRPTLTCLEKRCKLIYAMVVKNLLPVKLRLTFMSCVHHFLLPHCVFQWLKKIHK